MNALSSMIKMSKKILIKSLVQPYRQQHGKIAQNCACKTPTVKVFSGTQQLLLLQLVMLCALC